MCLNAWIIYFKKNARYNKNYIDFYIEEGSKLGIKVKLVLVEDLTFGVKENQWFVYHFGKEVEYPDFIIHRAIYPLLSKHFEYLGIPVFNNSLISEICNDKAKTYQYLAKTGINMIDSTFCYNQGLDMELERIKSPTVVKAVEGHGGSQVYLLKDGLEDMIYINQMKESLKSSDVVIQPLTGSKHQDLRVYVIGTEIIAAVLRTAKNGFKSNFSLGGEVTLYILKEEETQIVHKIIEQFEFGLVGIDFILGDEGQLIFNEIEDVVGSRMLYQCSDINIVELYLRYIRNRILG